MYNMGVRCFVRSVAYSTTDDNLYKKDGIAFSLTKITGHFNESLEFVFNI